MLREILVDRLTEFGEPREDTCHSTTGVQEYRTSQCVSKSLNGVFNAIAT